MKIIGLTGGIGSGKTTVSNILKEMNAIIIDSDIVYRDLVKNNTEMLDELVLYFGNSIIHDGILDRKKLGSLVFSDPVKLARLNKITHKYIIGEIEKIIASLKAKGNTEIIVVEAAIPIKGFCELVDEVWFVKAEREKRISRIMNRNNLSEEEALDRIQSQPSDDQYEEVSDRTVYNEGTTDELRKTISILLDGDIV